MVIGGSAKQFDEVILNIVLGKERVHKLHYICQRFFKSKIFKVFVFGDLFCSPSLHLFDPKYSKSNNIMYFLRF